MSSCSSASFCSDDLFILCPYWYCWVHPVYEADIQCAPTTVGVKTKCLQAKCAFASACLFTALWHQCNCMLQAMNRQAWSERRAHTHHGICRKKWLSREKFVCCWIFCKGLVSPYMASGVALWQCLSVIWSALWARWSAVRKLPLVSLLGEQQCK